MKDQSRTGRLARNRGNAYERHIANAIRGRRVGQFGGPMDVSSDLLDVQCKNGASYPERIDGWLRKIPYRADRIRAVVMGDAPGPGVKRRDLIIMDLHEFLAWFGPAEEENDGTSEQG